MSNLSGEKFAHYHALRGKNIDGSCCPFCGAGIEENQTEDENDYAYDCGTCIACDDDGEHIYDWCDEGRTFDVAP